MQFFPNFLLRTFSILICKDPLHIRHRILSALWRILGHVLESTLISCGMLTRPVQTGSGLKRVKQGALTWTTLNFSPIYALTEHQTHSHNYSSLCHSMPTFHFGESLPIHHRGTEEDKCYFVFQMCVYQKCKSQNEKAFYKYSLGKKKQPVAIWNSWAKGNVMLASMKKKEEAPQSHIYLFTWENGNINMWVCMLPPSLVRRYTHMHTLTQQCLYILTEEQNVLLL